MLKLTKAAVLNILEGLVDEEGTELKELIPEVERLTGRSVRLDYEAGFVRIRRGTEEMAVALLAEVVAERQVTIIVRDNGVEVDWWNEDVDDLLEALGVPRHDPYRNPWCG